MSSVAGSTIDYFLDMCANVLPQDSLTWYGNELPTFSAPLTLQVNGWRAESVPAELSPEARREEMFTFHGSLSSFAGDQDFRARQDEVMSAWSLITIAVGNDYTLGGNVRWAQIPRYEFVPDYDPNGGKSLGTLTFEIECQQRIATLT